RSTADFVAAIAAKAPGTKVTIRLIRGREEQTLVITLGRRPATFDADQFARLVGDWAKVDDPDQRIAALEAALKLEPQLKVWPLQAPREQIRGQLLSGLANSYLQRPRGDRSENIERAIKSFEGALTAEERERFPQDWASIQVGLANAYLYRVQGERA